MRFDIEKEFDYMRAQFHFNVSDSQIYNQIFNAMMMSEYKDWLTIDIIDHFVSQHPHVCLNGMGAAELKNTGRKNIITHLQNTNRLSASAMHVLSLNL